MRNVLTVVLIMFTSSVFSQTQTLTGFFYSPHNEGMHTDDWLNLRANPGATAINSWNIYHKDGGSILNVRFALPQPFIQVGLEKPTNFFVNGTVGIGTSSPVGALEVRSSNDKTEVRIRHSNEAEPAWGLILSQQSDLKGVIACGGRDLQIESGHDKNLILGNVSYNILGGKVIIPGGNVGIGTSTPDAKLTVKGNIHAQEVKVDLSGSVAPDYVFEKDYNLAPLTEVEAYIIKNKHLPEIPSALEMEEDGINLKQMNLLLLKKVEELTLYMIEQQKAMEQCVKKIEFLQSKVGEQEKVVDEQGKR